MRRKIIHSVLVFGILISNQFRMNVLAVENEIQEIYPGIRIPFTLERNKIILPVTINDIGPLKIILDSGMSYDGLLLFKQKYIDKLRIPRSDEYQISGAGNKGTSKAVTAEAVTFSAGDAVFKDQHLIILTSGQFEEFPTDGVTGYSLLGHYTVEINYDRMEIRLHDPETFEPGKDWESIPILFKGNQIPWVDIMVEIKGGDPVILSCYIDCASGETVEFLTREKNKFEVPSGLEPAYLGRGLSGDIHGHRGEIKKIRLGAMEAGNPEVVFAPAETRSKQPGADGVIGNGLLKRFNVIYDYRNGKLYSQAHHHPE
ncbi:aspartyl protease family protein [bacterium]|nr:aspartyl protease family protein [candidate division CSSED10-310 bacterium]